MMQHQYWVTKKTVLKKFGSKEDECIVSSDAELDAKLELFQSLSESSVHLQKILDQYQERVCFLAQEENLLGKFLRDSGKDDDSAGKYMVSAGKAISYSGQQRVTIRGPLLRLYNEVETFRGRAVSDMRATVAAMEKARIEYRAALSWMKAASSQLDPDTGRGLDNFRKAQRAVRESKQYFDKLKLDVLQKIDLLAAARCNMFSHTLANYQTSFLLFTTKIEQTLTSTAETMHDQPQFEFSILKDLSQIKNDGEEGNGDTTDKLVIQDEDQMLFFNAEYKDDATPDDKKFTSKIKDKHAVPFNEEKPENIDLFDTSSEQNEEQQMPFSSDLAGLSLGSGDAINIFGNFMPSQLLDSMGTSILSMDMSTSALTNADGPQSPSNLSSSPVNTHKTKKKQDMAAWFKIFAELDPLTNPDNLPGSNTNQSHAA